MQFKESIACNRPIVTTPVGDTEWLLQNVEGSFKTTFRPESVFTNIINALDFSSVNKDANSRKRIKGLGVSSDLIAKKIINIYKNAIINENNN